MAFLEQLRQTVWAISHVVLTEGRAWSLKKGFLSKSWDTSREGPVDTRRVGVPNRISKGVRLKW